MATKHPPYHISVSLEYGGLFTFISGVLFHIQYMKFICPTLYTLIYILHISH